MWKKSPLVSFVTCVVACDAILPELLASQEAADSGDLLVLDPRRELVFV